jgi:Ser/Thr protein kinase RdoA (MazF antagonist)
MCVGPAVQDMWMLLPDTVENSRTEIANFLKGYGTYRKFDKKELELIPALRGMRMVHFAAWCAIQKGEPHFEQHFPEWGTKKYWNQLINDIRGLSI